MKTSTLNPTTLCVPAKWILAGEHTVLRGGQAIACPLPLSQYHLELTFKPQAQSEGGESSFSSEELKQLFFALNEHVSIFKKIPLPVGHYEMHSHCPRGAGLGSSAALSVAIARLLLASHASSDLVEWKVAREIEAFFHGKSSGLDVATISYAQPILFSLQEGPRVLNSPQAQSFFSNPQRVRFTFHDTGLRALTTDCIQRVEASASAGDALMNQAVRYAWEGLSGEVLPLDRLQKIKQSMELSTEAYDEWGILPLEARKIQQELKAQGAIASRLTGAGLGGFVVAMWSAK